MLPDFTSDGVLPPGDYELSIDELRQSLLVLGRPNVTGENWDTPWRLQLVENVRILLGQLASVGLNQVYLDGSFVENKGHPGDIDGYFECPFEQFVDGTLERELNLLDPHGVWTWSRSSRQYYRGKLRLPMWMIYRVELYPHLTGLNVSSSSGIKDRFGNDLEFPAAFRQARQTFVEKGIVKVRM